MEFQDRLSFTYVLISHDLAVVRLLADEVLVMKDGRAVEHGPTGSVLTHPDHTFTRTLLDAIPGRGALEGAPS